MVKNRITGEHTGGKGDTGYSDLALGGRISKGTSLPKIYLAFDKLQHSLSNFIEFNPEEVDAEDLKFFEYLLQMTFAVNGFLWAAGETEHCDNLLFDSKAFDWMLSRIRWFQQEEKTILKVQDLYSEFIIPHGHINKLRLRVREVESEFWSYRDLMRDKTADKVKELIYRMDSHNDSKEKVKNNLEQYFIVRDRFIKQGSFLNKLSTYFYWLMRYHHVKAGGEFKQWMSAAPEWNV